jgi:(p)ppGpp synthase/HD superfamily hydrolase
MLSQHDETARIVAVLHDSLEDTSVTLADLRAAAYSDEICEAVDCLMLRPGEQYEDIITRVGANPLSRRVKLADLEDNMDPQRQLDGREGAEHLAKYQAAWKRLSEIR